MKKQSTNVLAFIIAILVIAGLVCVAIFGVGDMPGVFDEGGVTQGLDLVGGSYIVYEADAENPSEEDMAIVRSMLRQRLDSLGYTEATLAASGDNRIAIEIPAITDPEEAVQKLGSTAVLLFVDIDGTVWLEGSDIEKAEAMYGDSNGDGVSEHFVSLKIKSESVSKFAEATKTVSKRTDGNNMLIIALDEDIISYPYVDKELNTSDVIISGGFTSSEETVWLADLISAGKLPFALKEVQLESVGPTLGEKALKTSLIAGAIGLLLVMIFMMVFYRLPGVVATLALIAYSALMGIILVLGNNYINLSLPGIAGIILSIGMAVDANVVIFERIKEELRLGRSVGAAFTGGFKRAYAAVIDSNVTTLIAAAVLWYFGTGTVKGFAITLFIGVLLSLISAVLITRFLLARLVGMKIVNKKFYGA